MELHHIHTSIREFRFWFIERIGRIRSKEDMAKLADVNAQLDTLEKDVDAKLADITTQVTALESGVPTGATEADLDVVVGRLSTLNSKVNAFTLPAPTATNVTPIS